MKKLYFALVLLITTLRVFSQTSYYVNDNSTIGDVFTTAVGNDANPGTSSAPLLTLVAAYNLAQNGDTIFVDAGTYIINTDYILGKSLVFLGSNYNISPIDPSDRQKLNPARNTESEIAGMTMTVQVNNASFQGFLFDPGNRRSFITGSGGGSSFSLLKNRFKINSSLNQLTFTGAGTPDASPADMVNSGLNIADNRFEKYNSAGNITLIVQLFKNVTITGNSFVANGVPSAFNQTALGLGFDNRPVDEVYVTNNLFDSAGLVLNGGSLGHVVISGNTMRNTRHMYNFTNSFAYASEFEFSNNDIETSLGIPVMTYNRFGGVSGSSSVYKVENNVLDIFSPGTPPLLSSSLLNTLVASSVVNPSIIFRGNKITYDGDYGLVARDLMRPMIFRWNLKNVLVEKNEITYNGTNIGPTSINALPTMPAISIYTDNGVGQFIPSGSTIDILNNKIHGFKESVIIYDLNGGAGSSNDPYVGYGNLGAGINVAINNNSFTGDSISINNGTVSQMVQASCNWYGLATEQDVIPKISAGTVQHIPWLTNGTDSDPATGFQLTVNACNGYPGKLYVNDNSTTGDVFTMAVGNNANPGTAAAPFASLEYAISQSKNGDTIFVDAGSFSPPFNFTINKSLTILGPNYNISPVDETRMSYNENRNEEAIINGVLIALAADNIIIKGLVFDPGAKVQLSKADNGISLSNLTIAKNGFISTSNHGLINLVGKPSDVLASTNITIEDNAFVKEDGTTGQSITLNGFSGVNILNNSFLNEETATNLQHAIHLGANSKVNSIIIKGNVIDRPFNSLFTNFVGDILVDSNRVLSSFQPWSFGNNSPEPSTVTVSRNYFYIDRQSVNVGIGRSNATNNTGVNQINYIDNTFDINVDGFTGGIGTAYVYAQCNVSNTAPVYYSASKNRINVSGTFNTTSAFAFLTLRCNGKFSGIRIDSNEVNFTAAGFPSTAFSYGLVVNGNTGGVNIMPSGSVINIRNNKVSGFHRSVQFLGGTLPGVVANINNNSFTNNTLAIVNGNHINPSINATCNWYGATDANTIAPKIFSTIAGGITYSPWLLNGNDDEPLTPGLQPVPASCSGTPPVITLNAANNITCFGANNGSIDITISGGSQPYLIAWTNEEDENFSSSSEDLANLSPGTYDLTVTDSNGSVVTFEVFIDEPLLLEAMAGGSNNLCFGETNGTASVLATGGTAPYSYFWSNGATTADISNLAAGIYNVTVTDANGCTAQASYEVTQPTLLTASITNNSTACSNIATVVVAGGTTDYSYMWSNGATTAMISSVPAGTYNVTVTDANGCTASANVTLTVTEAFNPSASVTNVSCFGANTGAITVTNVNGTAPFAFSLDGINFVPGTLPYSFTGLAAGTYTVSVRDVNGCTGFVTKTVTQPTQLTTTLNSVQSTCFGLSTGAINVMVAGGTPSYTYQWAGPNDYSSTQLNISALAAGNYSLTVTDNKGCTVVLPVTVPSFSQITTNPVIQHVSCKNGNNGSIILNTTGGTGNLSYSWNTGQTTGSIFNLVKNNNYKVTITDIGSGCTLVQTFEITEPATLVSVITPSQDIVNVSGCVSLGSFRAVGSGGTPFPNPDPYRYSIDGINFQASQVFSNLNAGTYTVTVMDMNGCTAARPVTITDNGSDEYESVPNNPGNNNNNNKGKAAPISQGTPVSARIGTSGDVDYYKLSPSNTWVGSYTVNFSQPPAAVTYYLTQSNGTTVVTASDSSATHKRYEGLNGTYYLRVSGANSVACYQFTVNSTVVTRSSGTVLQQEVSKTTIGKNVFDVKVLGNPSPSAFTLDVITGSDEDMTIRVTDLHGRLMEIKQKLPLQQLIRIGDKLRTGVYFAEIIQGRNRKVVKLIKM